MLSLSDIDRLEARGVLTAQEAEAQRHKTRRILGLVTTTQDGLA